MQVSKLYGNPKVKLHVADSSSEVSNTSTWYRMNENQSPSTYELRDAFTRTAILAITSNQMDLVAGLYLLSLFLESLHHFLNAVHDKTSSKSEVPTVIEVPNL